MRNCWKLLKCEERVHSLSLSLTILVSCNLKSWSMQIVDRVTTQFANCAYRLRKLQKRYISISTHFRVQRCLLNNSDVLWQLFIALYFEYINMDDQFFVCSVNRRIKRLIHDNRFHISFFLFIFSLSLLSFFVRYFCYSEAKWFNTKIIALK